MFELEVKLLVGKILQLAAENNSQSDIIVAALADVIGITAATLDKEHGYQRLSDRLHTLNARIRETYDRVRNTIDTNGTHTK